MKTNLASWRFNENHMYMTKDMVMLSFYAMKVD